MKGGVKGAAPPLGVNRKDSDDRIGGIGRMKAYMIKVIRSSQPDKISHCDPLDFYI